MSFWWNKRETGSPYDAADALFESAVTLTHEPDRAQEAERSLAAAIGAYRKLVVRTQGVEAKRRLAKALWRDATFTALVRERPEAALTPAREALELGREVLRAVDPSHAAFDAVVQEVSGAMNDIAQLFFAANQPKERERLLIEAAELARRSLSVGGRQALGTALHNLAHHRLFELHSAPPSHLGRRSELTNALLRAERAFELRIGLCEESRVEPYFKWEFASSALLVGQLLHELGQHADASGVLAAGVARLRDVTGPSVESLRHQLTAALAVTGQPAPAPDEIGPLDFSPSTLSRGAAMLLELIGLLELEDRERALVAPWFADVWRARAGAAASTSFDDALAELVQRGLVTERSGECAATRYHLDYLVERAVRARVPVADAENLYRSLAQLWLQRFQLDCAQPAAHPPRAGMAAAVYARRAGEFERSVDLIEHHVMPAASRRGEGRYALLQLQLSADASDRRTLIERADRAAERLAGESCAGGRADQALDAAAYGLDYAQRRELGIARVLRWRELRLGVLYRMGRYAEVLDELHAMLPAFDAAPATERLVVLRLREAAMHHAAGAAKALKHWRVALGLNRSIVESLEGRGASPAEIAHQRSNDYAALLELGDHVAAEKLLEQCQAVLERGNHDAWLAYVVGARGIVTSRGGDALTAANFKRRSLALNYRAGASLPATAHAHDLYANELVRLGEALECMALHWCTAAVLYALAHDHQASANTLRKVTDARRIGSFAVPSTLDALTEQMVREGFPLDHLLRSTDSASASAVAGELLQRVQGSAASEHS